MAPNVLPEYWQQSLRRMQQNTAKKLMPQNLQAMLSKAISKTLP